MSPNTNNDSSAIDSKDFNREKAHTATAEDRTDPAAELARLEEEKKELEDMFDRLPELVAHKYPELAIARTVHQEACDRYNQEKRLRRKLGLAILTDKAYAMIQQEFDDRMSTYRDIAIRIEENKSAIVAAKYRLQSSLRKRRSEFTTGNETKKSRFE